MAPGSTRGQTRRARGVPMGTAVGCDYISSIMHSAGDAHVNGISASRDAVVVSEFARWRRWGAGQSPWARRREELTLEQQCRFPRPSRKQSRRVRRACWRQAVLLVLPMRTTAAARARVCQNGRWTLVSRGGTTPMQRDDTGSSRMKSQTVMIFRSQGLKIVP